MLEESSVQLACGQERISFARIHAIASNQTKSAPTAAVARPVPTKSQRPKAGFARATESPTGCVEDGIVRVGSRGQASLPQHFLNFCPDPQGQGA